MAETHGGASSSTGASGSHGALLFLLYLLTAFSDLLDGYFARKAGAPSAKWGRVDALADVLFNTSSLLAAAWLGLVGYWVPLGVVALAAQFLYRNSAVQPEPSGAAPGGPSGKGGGRRLLPAGGRGGPGTVVRQRLVERLDLLDGQRGVRVHGAGVHP